MHVTAAGRTIEKEIFVAVSPERAFRAWTEKEELERWFALEVDIDLRPDGSWRFQWSSMSATGTILEIDPPQLLVMEWDHSPAFTNTVSTIQFTPESDGTLIRLRISGYGEGPDWDAMYDGVAGGWATALADLKRWLEDGATDGTFRTS